MSEHTHTSEQGAASGLPLAAGNDLRAVVEYVHTLANVHHRPTITLTDDDARVLLRAIPNVPPCRPGITPAQELTLRRLCDRYGVDFNPSDYEVRPFDLPEGYVCGWVGGMQHSGALSGIKRTIYVGVSPQGEASS